MNPSFHTTTRVLALDPTSKGFGFVVLEGLDLLIDWGVRHAAENRNHRCLAQAAVLIERYRPDVLVVERTGVKGSRRRPRARRLIKSLCNLAKYRHLRPRRVSRRSVQLCFATTAPATKREVAVALAQRFPELESRLPRIRERWMSEDERTSIFDAAAFALTWNVQLENRKLRQSSGTPVSLQSHDKE